jgi:Na+-driven multidrug efflux pump
MPFVGFQVVSSNMFVVTGRPKISIFLSMLRQVLLLLPAIVIFGNFWGLRGLIYAMPFADVVSIIVTGILIFLEIRSLRRKMHE